jgi:hypothetical protein
MATIYVGDGLRRAARVDERMFKAMQLGMTYRDAQSLYRSRLPVSFPYASTHGPRDADAQADGGSNNE